MRGRKRKPLSLVGSKADRPQPQPAIPDCPDALQGDARDVWHRTARALHRLRVIAEQDQDALAIYAVAVAEFFEAETEIRKTGRLVRNANGFPSRSPWYAVRAEAWNIIRQLQPELGLTPASRTRLVAPPKKPPKAKTGWEGLIADAS